MTPAEFDTRRRMLGLSVEDTAQLCGGVSPRAVNNWFRGEAPLPKDAIEALLKLDWQIDNAIESAVRFAQIQRPDIVELKRYRTQKGFESSPHASQMPFGAHAVLIGLTTEALGAEGIATEIVWAD